VRARLRRRAQDLPFRGEADLAESLTRGDPEVDLQKQEGAALFRGALTRSLAEFGHRERTLLRLYFAEGTSLAALGRMYHVHESTMQRRILALRERLLHEVKSQLGLDSRGLASRMDLIRSQLDLHLSQLLKPQCPR
jgi:RNA polymerase sigma-70 factor